MATQNTHTGSGTQNNNNNQVINNVGRILVKNFTTSRSIRYKTLWDKVVGVGASHRAKHQFLRGCCLEGTRERILQILRDWRADKNGPPILWLSGSAGVGKTAIAMTVARACEEEGLLVSSFFFFRSDSNRNNPSALVLTIAHGLVSTIPLIWFFIQRRISKDPRILEAEMEDQFRELILIPIMQWSWYFCLLFEFFNIILYQIRKFLSDSPRMPKVPNIVIIDGLDECSDEETQLRVLAMIRSAIQQSPRLPLRFIICSRSESWIREAFDAEPLHQFTERVDLNEEFHSDEDIRRYYLHEFQQISGSTKYSHVRFPSPWPSPEELQSLIDRASGQFVYAATVIRFIRFPFSHPILQLHHILENTPIPRPGVSPYHELDALYAVILNVNPDQEKVLSMLQAILVLPYVVVNPACIELLLGLFSGEVSLTMRAMHSVLDIRGRGDRIVLYHTSFEEFLTDPNRSGHFHIDIPAQRYDLARRWLQGLTARKMGNYSVEQLYSDETKPFFGEWIDFCCDSFSHPTRDLLQDLYNVDLASTILCQQVHAAKPGTEQTFTVSLVPSIYGGWSGMFRRLQSWIDIYDEEEVAKILNHPADMDTNAESAQCIRTRCKVDLVKALKTKFSERPKGFHLEQPPDVPLQHIFVFLAVHSAAGCNVWTPSLQALPLPPLPPRLTECRCDNRVVGQALDHPGHNAFEEACLQVLRTCISDFKTMTTERSTDFGRLSDIFTTVLGSLLLRYCRLDAELLLLFQSFLESVKDCLDLRVGSEKGEELKSAVFEWVGKFPKTYSKEAEAIMTQVTALPWVTWDSNSRIIFERDFGQWFNPPDDVSLDMK